MTDLDQQLDLPADPAPPPTAEPVLGRVAEPGAASGCAVQAADMSAVVNRVKRAQGQLGGVLRMIEEGRDLEAVVHQLQAVSRALDRAGFALIAAELRQTVVDRADLRQPQLPMLGQVLLSLA